MWPMVTPTPSYASDISPAPSLFRSDDSFIDSGSSAPSTPTSDDASDLLANGLHLGSSRSAARHRASLPDIMDPVTAASAVVRNICCIGAGYVGGPTAAVIALHNPTVRVTVVDRDLARIRAWQSKHLPIHEPSLRDVVRAARDGVPASARTPNLFFSTACVETIATADMIFVSVNTPTKRRGRGAGLATDMTAFEGAIRDVALHARRGAIIVEKSTVPCRTSDLITSILTTHRPGATFPILSNPEFLAEGTAVRDLMKPERVIIGCESTVAGHCAAAALVQLYAAWVPRDRIAPINIWSSELCKLTANAMLAQRISSINAISAICERTGADVDEIALSVGMDRRIGSKFLKAGIGFGGSCFRKDVASLTYLAESLGLPEVAAYWQQVLSMNDYQRHRFAHKVISSLNNSLRGKKITILGYAFKKDTGDTRESPALDVIRILLEEDPREIAIYDPLCSEVDIQRELRSLADADAEQLTSDGPVKIFNDPYVACSDSNAILILTEWDMFKSGAKPLPTMQKEELEYIIAEGNVNSLPTFKGRVKSRPVSIWPVEPSTVLKNIATEKPNNHGDESVSGTEPSYLPGHLANALVPEPECADTCTICSAPILTSAQRSKTATPIDWWRISQIVRQPRLVFDGRGILTADAMASMGFRLETLGRASTW